MDHAASLARYPLFALLGRQALETWAACAKIQAVRTGETIFEAQTPGAWAFLVLEGQVRMLRPDGPEKDVSLGVFGPGEVFGEYALLQPHMNTATCRVARPGKLLRLPLTPLKLMFAKHPGVQGNLKNWLRLNVLVGFLREERYLGFMSANSSLPLLDRCQELTFPDGHTIQADGLGDDRWHFIQAGQVILQPGSEGEQPTVLGPGDCFGERALLGRPGLRVAMAQGEVRCRSLARADFNPSAARAGQMSIQTVHSMPSGRPFPWVGQEDAGDCGVASLTMIARSHGRPTSPSEILSLVELTADGANLLGLQRAAAALKLPCQAIRVDPARVTELALPAVAHLARGHYVAIYAAAPDGVVVGDPASAIVTWSTSYFQQHCSGHFLLFTGTAPSQAQG